MRLAGSSRRPGLSHIRGPSLFRGHGPALGRRSASGLARGGLFPLLRALFRYFPLGHSPPPLLFLSQTTRDRIIQFPSQDDVFSRISPLAFVPARSGIVFRGTILSMRQPVEGRVVVTSRPNGLRVEIRPLVRTRAARRLLALAAILLMAAALFGGARPGPARAHRLRPGRLRGLALPWLPP